MSERCQCTARITDKKRAQLWSGIFPNDEIPIKGPLPAGRARTQGEDYPYFLVDLSRVSEEQLNEIHRRAAKAFGITLEEAEEETYSRGLIVKAYDVVVTRCPLHLSVMS